MSWPGLTEIWLSELRTDPTYETVVTPLLLEVLSPRVGFTYLDLGCGEGRVMRSLVESGSLAHGLDINFRLVSTAGKAFVAELPTIPVRSDTYDGLYAALSLEHIEDHAGLFSEAARVTKPDGVMTVVMNHPSWTAPGSTPITDGDGEVLWRPGRYFSDGSSTVRIGEVEVTFHHRSMATILTTAAAAGWALERMIEKPHHDLDDQTEIPRLLACRWRLLP